MHKAPQVNPAGLCVCMDRTKGGDLCKICGWLRLKPSPEGEGGRALARSDEGQTSRADPLSGNHNNFAPHQSASGVADSFPLRGSLVQRQVNNINPAKFDARPSLML